MREAMMEMNDTSDGSETDSSPDPPKDINDEADANDKDDDNEENDDDDEDDDDVDPEEADDDDIAALIAASTGGGNDNDDNGDGNPIVETDRFQRILPSQFDIVYTYVNKSMSKTITNNFKNAKKGLKATDNRAAKSSRYRDRGELCFSLRSVEKFLPWFTGNIHIVTSTVPEWLDINHPRIRVVTEESIMDPDHLPTYNSMAVEANIPKVPAASFSHFL
jgi:hypothetical protein